MAFCPHCGALVEVDDAKYCNECGKPLFVVGIEQPTDGLSPEPTSTISAPTTVESTSALPLQKPSLTPKRGRLNKVGLWIFGVLFFFEVFVTAWRAYQGEPIAPPSPTANASLLLGLFLFGWGLIHCYARFAWWKSIGMAIAVAWAVFMACQGAREHFVVSRFLDATEKLDPKIKQEYIDAGANSTAKSVAITKATVAALVSAPDWAVVYYWNKRLGILYDPQKHEPACAHFVRPSTSVDPGLNVEESQQLEYQLVALEQAAVASPTPFVVDQSRSDRLMEHLRTRNALVDDDAAAHWSDLEACAFAHKQFEEIRTMSESDQAYFTKLNLNIS